MDRNLHLPYYSLRGVIASSSVYPMDEYEGVRCDPRQIKDRVAKGKWP